MLEKLREGSQGVAAKVILGLVILSFALAGVGSYVASPSTPLAAEVNGEPITRAEFDQNYQNERARLENQLGAMFNQLAADPTYLEQFRQGVLERMIETRLLDQVAEQMGLRASDAQVKASIRGMQEFQTDGAFDNERYIAALYRAGLGPDQFRDMMRADITRRQLQVAVLGSEFATGSEANIIAELDAQKRVVRYVTVPVASFSEQAAPSDEEVQSYYDENQANFMNEEAVALEYILVDSAELAKNLELEADAVEDYYQQNIATYSVAEKRKVAHILVADEDKANEIASKLAAGEDFAELAKTESEDTFSGEQGGELDWFERGVMAPEFEEAAFGLAIAGEVTEVVKTDFGFHLIKLLEVEASTSKPLAEVEQEITERLKQEQAANLYYEKAQRLSELAFELPDSLDEVATETGLELASIEQFTRSSAVADLANPLVLNQAFKQDFIEEGLNSDLIDLGDNKAIVIRVNSYQAASVKPLEEVKSEVVEAITLVKSNQAASQFADQVVAALNDGQEVREMLAEQKLAISANLELTRNSAELDPQVVRQVFSMPKVEGTSERVAQFNGDQTIVQLMKIEEQDSLNADAQQQWQQQLVSVKTDASYKQLVEVLKSKADIKNLL